ncbi:MAG: arylsulfatase [Capnocytophaga sp.]|nr:arylsulfatase [Capnocytophaga sp.]
MNKYFNVLIVFLLLVNTTIAQDKPNIIFILADDLGIGDIEPYGQQIIKTPNLQKMADEGMTFSNFYAGSTVCAPSRASLLTGQHTGNTQVRGNGEYPLDPNKKIFPQLLKEAGYQNAIFGKWGMGLKDSGSTPKDKGFDRFVGHLHHVDAHFQRPDSVDVYTGGMSGKMPLDGAYANDVFVEETLRFIKENAYKNPFFVYVSLTVPHAELKLPERYMKEQLLDGQSIHPDEKSFKGGHYGAQQYPRAAYAAMVQSIDHYVGQIIAQVKESGIQNNTLVIFTSDNGTHLEGGRRMDDVHYFQSSGIYRGVKRDLFEGGIRVPFIAHWEGYIAPNRQSNHQAAFWDIYPTFAELAGITIPSNDPIDGISVVPSWTGKKQKKHPYLYWEFHEFGGKQAVIKGKWKAVRIDAHKNPDNELMLFNVKKDPDEKRDLSDTKKRKYRKMKQLLDGIRTENTIFNFRK